LGADEARRFFEANFVAERSAGEGVLTAYFAPEYPARRAPDAEFSAPVRAKPADLKVVDGGLFDPAMAGRPSAAVDPGDGRLQPYPDRAAIEATPPGGSSKPTSSPSARPAKACSPPISPPSIQPVAPPTASSARRSGPSPPT
jgi:hypothetical protein